MVADSCEQKGGMGGGTHTHTVVMETVSIFLPSPQPTSPPDQLENRLCVMAMVEVAAAVAHIKPVWFDFGHCTCAFSYHLFFPRFLFLLLSTRAGLLLCVWSFNLTNTGWRAEHIVVVVDKTLSSVT